MDAVVGLYADNLTHDFIDDDLLVRFETELPKRDQIAPLKTLFLK
jgi:hypothetical protein